MSFEREGLPHGLNGRMGAGDMGIYIETGVGRAISGKDVEMGRKAASGAVDKLSRLSPTLAIVFVSAELDVGEVARGVADVLGDCPVIGTSTAGEICDDYRTGSVVVAVIASPHLRVQVGVGKDVSSDYKKAVRQGLVGARVSEYFDAEHPLHQMLRVPASKSEAVSPAFLIAFSPGAVQGQVSFGHDIHTELRKASANRIPIFGGTSADAFRFEANYQICNGTAYEDAVVLAFVETEILFGLGMAHGFSPTSGRALVTKASDHIIHELDGRPAIDVAGPPRAPGGGARRRHGPFQPLSLRDNRRLRKLGALRAPARPAGWLHDLRLGHAQRPRPYPHACHDGGCHTGGRSRLRQGSEARRLEETGRCPHVLLCLAEEVDWGG